MAQVSHQDLYMVGQLIREVTDLVESRRCRSFANVAWVVARKIHNTREELNQ